MIPHDYHLRSWRVFGALSELRVARRLGRQLTDDEARRLEGAPDPLRMRALALRSGCVLARVGRHLTFRVRE